MESSADALGAPLIDAVKAAVAAARGVRPPAAGPLHLGVACSGGPDSTALAGAVVAAGLGPVTLVHVDHGLRPESAADAVLVRRLAATLGCRVEILVAEVDRRVASIEAAARTARYAALDDAAAALELAWVLTAHTADDQAETVLHRIVRGTGVRGLAGIQRARPPYLRPWLELPRNAVHAYVAALGLPTVADPMNRDPARFRTRSRGDLLPRLAGENPEIVGALCRLADAAAETDSLLEALATGLLASAAAPEGGLATAVLARAHPAVRKRALMVALDAAGLAVEAGALEQLVALIEAPTAGTRAVDLAGGRALRVYDRLSLELQPPRAVGAGGASPAATKLEIIGEDGPYALRTWRPGDRMRPARLRGRSRKLSDLFIDARVPREERRSAQVVVRQADGEILWAEHLGAAFGAKLEVRLTAPPAVAT